MPDLFDFEESLNRKREGMELAENNSSDLELAREIARDLARRFGAVHADMVGRILKNDYGIESLGPAAGSLFKGKEWEFTGHRHLSSRKTNHGRELKIWRLKHA